ncbi:unnamed protein product [Schistocephalus solidus]|uniref:Flocculation protein FLO11-like n=1 Tax=Schistocephalus solidus TaxID=70667 RepID=A0A183SGI1_SCHSO|nr:unnamed protein product [Schistocephalus solidus]
MAFTDSESCAGLHAEGNIAGSVHLNRLISQSTANSRSPTYLLVQNTLSITLNGEVLNRAPKSTRPCLEKDGSSIPAILEEYLREVARHGQTLKIHNLDPRFSDHLRPDDSSILNGSLTDGNSTGSAVDTSLSKRSDEDEEDDDGFPKPSKSSRMESSSTAVSESTAWSTTVTSPRPRISFHRPISSAQGCDLERPAGRDGCPGFGRWEEINVEEPQSSPTKSPGDDEKPAKIPPDLSTNVDLSPSYVQVPGKQSLQRPFLSALKPTTASDVFRSLESTTSVGNDEHHAFDTSTEKTDVMSIRRLFPETDSEGAELSKLPSPVASAPTSVPVGVPHIDQMLRPMGQLEAFVNTISMSASLESSGADSLTVPSESSVFCPSESSPTSTTESDQPSEPLSIISMTSTEETLPAQPSSEEIVKIKEDEDVVPDDPVHGSYTQAAENTTTQEDNKECSEDNAATLDKPLTLKSSVVNTASSCQDIRLQDLEDCASSAKRPRLKSPPTSEYELSSKESQDSVSADLSRASVNKMDQESGEWVPATESAITETTPPANVKLPSLESIPASEQQLEEGSSAQIVEEPQAQLEVEAPAAATVVTMAEDGTPNAHIDSETGEQESS